jgi:hypothetical protein
MDRRTALKLAAAAPLAGAFTWTDVDADQARRAAASARAAAAASGNQFQPQFFTPHEWRTVRLLADMIIPADERSGSASDAGVPEFMDFMMADQPARQVAMRGGLAWLDVECRRRFARPFIDCDDAQRAQLLDAIAWPARARPEDSHGVAFFTSFRDLTASGFWSSRVGVEDLQYTGNTIVPEWNGCPEDALRRFDVAYDD